MKEPVRRTIVFLFFTLTCGIPLTDCASKGGSSSADSPSAGFGGCPSGSTSDEIMRTDFAKTFDINAEAALQLRAATAAAFDIQALADSVDGELTRACGKIAQDLGAGVQAKPDAGASETHDGADACNLAIKAINDTKTKLGMKTQLALVIRPPLCTADLDRVADCAKLCEPKIDRAQAKADCEAGKLTGACGGKCDGACEPLSPAKCDGDCNGSCEGDFRGQCGGACKGRCDGKSTGAGVSCTGECHGTCDATVKGRCSGKCDGTCSARPRTTCDGACIGKCDADMKSPKCAGEVKPPEMSPDCKAHCDAEMSAKLACRPASVGLAITGGADNKLASDLKSTLEKNLPAILRVSVGLGERSAKMALNGKAVVEGVQGSIGEIAKTSGDPAKAKAIGAQIEKCFGERFKTGASAAGRLKADVDVSINVQASASSGIAAQK